MSSRRVELSTQLRGDGTPQCPITFGLVDRQPQLVRVRPGGHAVPDGSSDRRHRQCVDLRDIGRSELAAVRSVHLTAGRPRMVVPRDGQVDTRRVHIGQSVQLQRRLVRYHSSTERPCDRRGKVVVLAARQHRHPVHPAPGSLESATRCHQTQLRGVYIQLPRVAGRHVPVLLCCAFDHAVPHSHVRNRISQIRSRTYFEEVFVRVERLTSHRPTVCSLTRQRIQRKNRARGRGHLMANIKRESDGRWRARYRDDQGRDTPDNGRPWRVTGSSKGIRTGMAGRRGRDCRRQGGRPCAPSRPQIP